MAADEQPGNLLAEFTELLDSGTLSQVRERLQQMHAADIARILESLPQEDRQTIWELTPREAGGDVLAHVNEGVRSHLIRDMDKEDLIVATGTLDTDDLADIFQNLPHIVTREVMQAMGEAERQQLEQALAFPEDSAGGLMNFDMITIRPGVLVDVVMRYLRRRGSLPATTDCLFVVDRQGLLLGTVQLADLVVHAPEDSVDDFMNREPHTIKVQADAREVASLFERRDLVSAAVVNDDNMLMGRITIDDVVDVIRDEADHSMMGRVGLSEDDDIFAPVTTSSARRAIWLGINLLTALLASWVIGNFEATIAQLVALAVLMPVVASMGGIAGSQTLTLVIRGIALEHISESNARKILRKELAVGILNGLTWALVVGLIALYWFGSFQLGLIFGMAVCANLVVAALAGTYIPLLLKRANIDPALAGGVLLTTVTDVIGFFAFLGMAAIFLV